VYITVFLNFFKGCNSFEIIIDLLELEEKLSILSIKMMMWYLHK